MIVANTRPIPNNPLTGHILKEFWAWLVTRWDRIGAMLVSALVFAWLVAIIWIALAYHSQMTRQIKHNEVRQAEDRQAIMKIQTQILEQGK